MFRTTRTAFLTFLLALIPIQLFGPSLFSHPGPTSPPPSCLQAWQYATFTEVHTGSLWGRLTFRSGSQAVQVAELDAQTPQELRALWAAFLKGLGKATPTDFDPSNGVITVLDLLGADGWQAYNVRQGRNPEHHLTWTTYDLRRRSPS